MIRRAPIALVGLLGAGFVVAVGTFWAFQRGAPDFSVFRFAWRLVLAGHGSEIYRNSPDRFLYAPGFAWLFSWLASFPTELALAFWCLLKAAIIGCIVKSFASRLDGGRGRVSSLGVCAWAVVFLAKPILIDFQYGQVNIFILGASLWALLSHFERREPSFQDTLAWLFLAIAGVAKVFPLPLLIVPWVVTKGIQPRRLTRERIGVLAGLAIVLLVPIFTQGFQGTLDLYLGWKQALISKGLPMESHNQSFTAFLHHYLSGETTPVIAESSSGSFGVRAFSESTITLLSMAWTFITAGFFLGWIVGPQGWPRGSVRGKAPLVWIAVAVALMILPSHLVWKPYFVMSLPVAILALHYFSRKYWMILLPLFLLVNFSGFDFIGQSFGAAIEAAAFLLFAHLVLLGMVLTAP